MVSISVLCVYGSGFDAFIDIPIIWQRAGQFFSDLCVRSLSLRWLVCMISLFWCLACTVCQSQVAGVYDLSVWWLVCTISQSQVAGVYALSVW